MEYWRENVPGSNIPTPQLTTSSGRPIRSAVFFLAVIFWAGTRTFTAGEEDTRATGPAVVIKPLSEIVLDVRPTDEELPLDRSAQLFTSGPDDSLSRSSWAYREFHWEATEFWHQPLYFDDVPLERYGQSRHPLVQPALSGSHFFGTVPILPYQVGIDRPLDLIPTVGYYRPGSPAPCTGHRIPLQADAAALEAGAWIALIFLLP